MSNAVDCLGKIHPNHAIIDRCALANTAHSPLGSIGRCLSHSTCLSIFFSFSAIFRTIAENESFVSYQGLGMIAEAEDLLWICCGRGDSSVCLSIWRFGSGTETETENPSLGFACHRLVLLCLREILAVSVGVIREKWSVHNEGNSSRTISSSSSITTTTDKRIHVCVQYRDDRVVCRL